MEIFIFFSLSGFQSAVVFLRHGRQLGDQLFGAAHDQRRHLATKIESRLAELKRNGNEDKSKFYSFDFSGGESRRDGCADVPPFLVSGEGQHFAEILRIGQTKRLIERKIILFFCLGEGVSRSIRKEFGRTRRLVK